MLINLICKSPADMCPIAILVLQIRAGIGTDVHHCALWQGDAERRAAVTEVRRGVCNADGQPDHPRDCPRFCSGPHPCRAPGQGDDRGGARSVFSLSCPAFRDAIFTKLRSDSSVMFFLPCHDLHFMTPFTHSTQECFEYSELACVLLTPPYATGVGWWRHAVQFSWYLMVPPEHELMTQSSRASEGGSHVGWHSCETI